MCVCVCVIALTIGGRSNDFEQDLVIWRVLIVNAQRRVGDDDSRVFLHVDAADRHHGLSVLSALLQDEIRAQRKIPAITRMFAETI